jgi:chloramphenicol 3-O-phosphotransferase
MPLLNIILEGDGALRDRDVSRMKIADNAKPITLVLLNGGMESGKHSVSLYIEMPDGSSVFAETSLALFEQAAAAFRGRLQYEEAQRARHN